MISTDTFWIYVFAFLLVQILVFSIKYAAINMPSKTFGDYLFFALFPYYGFGSLMYKKEF